MAQAVVVEELVFEMESELLEAWLARERVVWDPYLLSKPGFLRKEVWLSADDPAAASVRVVIWWESREQWKAIPPDELAELDERMGPLLRAEVCREHRLVRQA